MPATTRRAARSPRKKKKTFAIFWHFYLREHARPLTRAIHAVGTVAALSTAALSSVRGWGWRGLGASLACGYVPAWAAHFLIEGNRPASFKRPLFSFCADLCMAALCLSSRLGPHLKAAGVT